MLPSPAAITRRHTTAPAPVNGQLSDEGAQAANEAPETSAAHSIRARPDRRSDASTDVWLLCRLNTRFRGFSAKP
jgi:hypothetical protein